MCIFLAREDMGLIRFSKVLMTQNILSYPAINNLNYKPRFLITELIVLASITRVVTTPRRIRFFREIMWVFLGGEEGNVTSCNKFLKACSFLPSYLQHMLFASGPASPSVLDRAFFFIPKAHVTV